MIRRWVNRAYDLLGPFFWTVLIFGISGLGGVFMCLMLRLALKSMAPV